MDEIQVHIFDSKSDSKFRLLTNSKLSCAMVALFTVLLLGKALQADQDLPREQLPTSWKSDAELTDLFFLDAKLGWAVGAQGVILRTTDGGEQWSEISQASGFVADDIPLDQKLRNMQSGIRTRYTGVATGSTSTSRPIRCRFDSVHFVDANNGWIAGGYEVPYVGRSRAVVMRTADGGRTWQSIPNLVIPRISKIHFSNRMSGWAFGQTGNLFQTGIFYTSNGGQTWASKSSASMPQWKDAIQTKQGFVGLSDEGKIGLIKSNQFEPSVMLQKDAARINQIHMVDDQTGWAVGENGSWVQTQNGGLSWTQVKGFSESANGLKGATFSETIKEFDLQSIAVTDENVWMAGAPGTILFGVDRKTGETTISRLPTQNRINKLHFADAQNGWAIGSFGTIMATKDGGENWHVQRGQNRRVTVLTVSPSVDSVPFELFSKYASEENVLCASVLLNSTAKQKQIVDQAIERIGGTDSVLVNGHREKALKSLVRSIRTLQPNVIVCNSQHNDSIGKLGFNCTLLVQDAIRMASDQNSFPEQIQATGMNAWQTNRLAILDQNGSVGVDPHQLLTRTGKLIEDQIAISRAITGQTVLPSPLRYRVTELSANGRIKSGNLLSGLVKTNFATRSESRERHGSLASIHQTSAKQKTFDGLAKFQCNTPQDFLVWRQKVQSLALKMDSDVAGVWLMQLAERYLVAGKLELAAGSAELLVQRFSDHAFSPAALAWLAHYYGSDEFGQVEFSKRIESGQIRADGSIALAGGSDNEFETAPQAVQSAGGVSQLVWTPINAQQKDKSSKTNVELATNDEAVDDLAIENARQTFFDQRHQRAGLLLKQLSRRDPELVASPQFKTMDAHLARQISGKITNGGRWKNLAKRTRQNQELSIGAQRELILGGFETAGTESLTALTCKVAPTRPMLDGKLHEAIWQSSIHTNNLISSSVYSGGRKLTTKPDFIMLAHDDAFLYVGINCQKIKGNFYDTRKEARKRDANLGQRDRVELLIDVDRDYRSAFKFVVDHRGWVNESCAGSVGWDPQWYVSQSEDATSWTIEAAIPLSEISNREIDSKTTWAIQTSRRMFSSGNLWEDPNERGKTLDAGSSQSAIKQPGPLQLGLESRPELFDLIGFQAEGDENSATNAVQSATQFEPLAPNGPVRR